ncbi:hypothetical protein Ahu01nite_079940 [Winogradskya humida]|uniref:Uncharacterized protein n=1 Tax=Winogradskya humida TaxID=113566 RepID=A0ABQ4A3G6_9ACTN|nr:hypothetical protein Ahu01nite_079940 [Actinoplanes humidus]
MPVARDLDLTGQSQQPTRALPGPPLDIGAAAQARQLPQSVPDGSRPGADPFAKPSPSPRVGVDSDNRFGNSQGQQAPQRGNHRGAADTAVGRGHREQATVRKSGGSTPHLFGEASRPELVRHRPCPDAIYNAGDREFT